MVSIIKTIYVLLFLVIMASLSVAGNPDKTDQDLTDIGEEKLNRNQLKNPTLNKLRCVPRNGRCATDLDCCNGIPCHGSNGNLRCLTDHDYNTLLKNGFITTVAIIFAALILGVLCGLCRAHYGI